MIKSKPAGCAQDGVQFECPVCGNHVCTRCAKANFMLCPHCFSRLCRIS